MRVLVFGNSGSGKSTLSRRLAEVHGLTHLDLDTVAWDTDAVTPTLRELDDVHDDLDDFTRENEDWVVEGCYADVLALLAPEATHAVFLDLDAEACRANAKARPWEPHKYASKAQQDEKLAFLLDWVQGYYTRSGPLSHAAHQALYAAYHGPKQHLTAPAPPDFTPRSA